MGRLLGARTIGEMDPMKRFHLFAGLQPSTRQSICMDHYVASFGTMDDARAAFDVYRTPAADIAETRKDGSLRLAARWDGTKWTGR
jgi:hypothetical protein